MLSWNDYDMKREQYADMRRVAVKRSERRALRAQRQPRRMLVWAWFGRTLGRSLITWGARLEARYNNWFRVPGSVCFINPKPETRN